MDQRVRFLDYVRDHREHREKISEEAMEKLDSLGPDTLHLYPPTPELKGKYEEWKYQVLSDPKRAGRMNLSVEEYCALYIIADGNCSSSGIPFDKTFNATIDRCYDDGLYEIGNVTVMFRGLNFAKQSYDEFKTSENQPECISKHRRCQQFVWSQMRWMAEHTEAFCNR